MGHPAFCEPGSEGPDPGHPANLTHDGETVMDGAPGFLRTRSEGPDPGHPANPTHDGETVMDGAPGCQLPVASFIAAAFLRALRKNSMKLRTMMAAISPCDQRQ